MATLNVWCLLVDHNNQPLGSCFKVTVSDETDISDLKKKVKEEKRPELDQVAADRLTVLRCKGVNLSSEADIEELQEALDRIDLQNKAEAIRLASGKRVLKLELNDDEILLVQSPVICNLKRLYSEIADHQVEEMNPPKYLKFVQGQDDYAAEAMAGSLPASGLSKVFNFEPRQKAEKSPIYNGRPLNKTGPPVGLFHPVFNEFLEGINSSDRVPLGIWPNVHKFIEESTAMYNVEEKRMEKIKPVLNDLLGMQLTVIQQDKVKSNGSIMLLCNGWSTFLLILEVKNEIGTGGSDPFVQASVAYQLYWSNKNMVEVRHRCCCPTMLVAIAGPWICVGGAVYKQSVIAEPLTDYVYAGYNNWRRLGRIFHYLKTSLKSLEGYYSTVPMLPAGGISGFPYVCEYDGVEFSYVERLYLNKEVYKVIEGDEVRVVKFATQYNRTAHNLLAGAGFAPRLRHVSSCLYGGRMMIVMDYVDGETTRDLVLSQEQRSQLKKAIERLHRAGLVYGDLRRPNILLSGDSVVLVDFDWCGEDGEAVYPADLNPAAAHWVEGVGAEQVMRKEHDIGMLARL